MTVRVAAASRLHFGLVHVPVPGEAAGRSYGGLGLMIDAPGVTVTAEPAAAWSFAGSLAARAKTFCERPFCERMNPNTPFAVTADGPREHVGLGVGTALGLAVVAALTTNYWRRLEVGELALLAGRGERSGVGVHGFGHGGLIVDRGKAPGEVISRCQSVPFPAEWRVVLVRPAVAPHWHGPTERAAFSAPEPGQRERLIDLRDRVLVPSITARDFAAFSESVHEFNRIAGEPFAISQGGPYAGPAVTDAIQTLRDWGVTGVGQSSWGPTVFAFAEHERDAEELATRAREKWADVIVTAAAGPATVSVS